METHFTNLFYLAKKKKTYLQKGNGTRERMSAQQISNYHVHKTKGGEKEQCNKLARFFFCDTFFLCPQIANQNARNMGFLRAYRSLSNNQLLSSSVLLVSPCCCIRVVEARYSMCEPLEADLNPLRYEQ